MSSETHSLRKDISDRKKKNEEEEEDMSFISLLDDLLKPRWWN
jgi:hypothetical protein